ncbi:hypothetical protein [Cetobacterium sp.]|uniref:hypothetical protein n=1 Tax=Cetobacterium sp. TaxID=2071632 RepID=UPI003EE67620
MNSSYKEVTLKFIVLKECSKDEILKNAVNIVDKYICKYSEEYHKKQTLKDYCVSRVEPALSNIYKRGDIVSIKIRSDKKEITEQFKNDYRETDCLKTILIDEKLIFNKNKISEIYTLTPAIFSADSNNKYILNNRKNLDELKKNLIKNGRAKSQLGEEHDFIESIVIKNSYPISIKITGDVNGIVYLADKLQIKVKSDKVSQRIVNALITKGLGRHCTCGNGFINYKK